MVGGLIAANSSTILTHLNWGASYLVHDFYRRFINKGASERHYVWMGRVATVGLFVCAAALTFVLDTAKDAFDIILQIGAGTGLLYLLRWFWWRVNAWCEVVAMVSSFAISLVLLIVARKGFVVPTHIGLLITVAVTTVCWVLTAFVGPETDRQTLIEFYRKVRPFGPGWRKVRIEAGISESEAKATHENIPLALVGWVSGCAVVWSGLFLVGNLLYGRITTALLLLGTLTISGLTLVWVINRLWSGTRKEVSTGEVLQTSRAWAKRD
jgi:Na+/proline symporter